MSNKPIIVWSDPPESKGWTRRGRYVDLVEELKRNPGKWGCVSRNPNRKPVQSMCTTITKAKSYQRQASPGRIQAVTRRTRDGDDYGLWARWVPPKDAS